MKNPLRIIFLGTPAFSVSTLETLLSAPSIEVIGVITPPDKPAGRGNKLTPPPVKILAQEKGLPVFQPKSLRKDQELIQWIREQAPDFLVTIAFGQILSQEVLDIPKFGTVNVHASLLPELRGANPIQWALIQGKAETGLTTMLTDIGVDTGDMLLKESTPIGPEDTAETVALRLSEIAGPLLLKTLLQRAEGKLSSIPQPHEQATHAPKLAKEDAVIDWTQPVAVLDPKIRGQQPWPGALTFFNGERVKILKCRQISVNSEDFLKTGKPGEILDIIKTGIRIQTGQGLLEVLEVQPAGKRGMPARDWALGALREQEHPRFTASEEVPV